LHKKRFKGEWKKYSKPQINHRYKIYPRSGGNWDRSVAAIFLPEAAIGISDIQ